MPGRHSRVMSRCSTNMRSALRTVCGCSMQIWAMLAMEGNAAPLLARRAKWQ